LNFEPRISDFQRPHGYKGDHIDDSDDIDKSDQPISNDIYTFTPMYIYRDVHSLSKYLDGLRKDDNTIGFVPTMGALHQGHISLLDRTNKDCDHSVVSIFVNPTQFNDPRDLSKYPRPVESDIQKLYENHCDVVFIPSVDEVYPKGQKYDVQIDFGGLDKGMEGRFRPGHFSGVAQVMYRLLRIVQPQRLFMGQKDFQQSSVVRQMIRYFNLPVELVMCQTVREPDGLAMSSRNQHLDPKLRDKASLIFQVLQRAKTDIDAKPVAEIRSNALDTLTFPEYKPEYFEIVDGKTLSPVEDAAEHNYIVACCAVWAGNIRLIDNIIIRAN
jgi:pantoate--beta-alanine ligase